MKLTNCYQPRRSGLPLSESPNTLSRFFDGMTVPTFTMNKNHIITHWNTACAELTGIPAIDIIGSRNAWQAFYPRIRPVLADLIVDVASESTVAWYYNGRYTRSRLATGGYEAQNYFPSLGDEGRYLQFAATALRDFSGRIVGAIETLQDITTHRRAAKTPVEIEEHLQALNNETPDMIRYKDESGRWLPI